jgi:hypothetical protein
MTAVLEFDGLCFTSRCQQPAVTSEITTQTTPSCAQPRLNIRLHG